MTVPKWTLLLVSLGYLAIYAITPYYVVWHVVRSEDRLILQLFPALLYVIAWEKQYRKEVTCQK